MQGDDAVVRRAHVVELLGSPTARPALVGGQDRILEPLGHGVDEPGMDPRATTAPASSPSASRAPATSVATTLRAVAIASSSVSDIPSHREGRDDHVGRREPVGDVVAGPDEVDALARGRPQLGACRAVADKDEPGVLAREPELPARLRAAGPGPSRGTAPDADRQRPVRKLQAERAARRSLGSGRARRPQGRRHWERPRSGRRCAWRRRAAARSRSRTPSNPSSPAARRSQTAAARRIGPRKASNDQPCGWKRSAAAGGGRDGPRGPPWRCRCTRSGSSAAISRASDRVSSSAPGPGERFASQASNRAPVFRLRAPARHETARRPRRRARVPPGRGPAASQPLLRRRRPAGRRARREKTSRSA